MTRTAGQKKSNGVDLAAAITVKMKIVEILEARTTTLSVNDVVEITGLSRSKVYQKIARGELAAIRIDGSIKVDPNHLIQWLKEHQTGISSAVTSPFEAMTQKAPSPVTTRPFEQAV